MEEFKAKIMEAIIKSRMPIDKITHTILSNTAFENRNRDGLKDTYYYVLNESELIKLLNLNKNKLNITKE